MSNLPECNGHRKGDHVYLNSTGVSRMREYGTFVEGKPYLLEHDGSACPWFIRAPEGNAVFLNPIDCLKPVGSVPQPFQKQDAPKSVKKQKEVARELLIFCMAMDYQAFLAGGAPRNWHLGLEANDLDIFLRVPNGAPESHMVNVLEAFGVTNMFNLSTHIEPGVRRNQRAELTQSINKHESLSKIEYVLQGNYCGQIVQFIFLQPRTVMGVNYTRKFFDTSINMITASIVPDGDLGVDRSLEFADSMNTGVIFVQANGNPYGDNRHLEKVHNYFPGAPLVPMDYRSQVSRNPSKAYEYEKDWEDFNN